MSIQDKEDKALWDLYSRDIEDVTDEQAHISLPEHLLSAYIDDRLSEQDKQRVEQQLAWDQEALDSVLIIKESESENIEDIAPQITKRLKAIVPEQSKAGFLQTIISTLSLNERNFNLAMATSFSIVFIVGFQLGISTQKNTFEVDNILFDELLVVDNTAISRTTIQNTGVKN